MAIGQFMDYLLIGLAEVPCFLKNVLVGELLDVQSLERGTDAHEIFATLLQGPLDALAGLLDTALHVGVPAKVAQVTPDERQTIETVVLTPHFFVFAVVVKHRHLALWDAGEHGAGAFTGVVDTLVVEEPCHLQPLSLGVHGSEAFIDVPGHLVQVVGLKTGRIHLVKRVDAIDVVGAEQACLLLKEHALDAAVERILAVEEIGAVLLVKASPPSQGLNVGLGVQVTQGAWHMPGKCWQNGAHVQRPLTLDDALLQCGLLLQPLLRQRSTPTVNVGHAVPRQVSRSREVGAHLLIAHAHAGPHVIPHRLLSRDGERQVHAVQGHPIDEAFPVLPLPERHRVAPSAIVEEKTLRHARFHPLGGRHVGQDIGVETGTPAYHDTVVLQ